MISQFFILTPRGDSIVSRDYRGDVVRGTAEIFFRKVKTWPGGDPPPVFSMENIHFLHVKRNNLWFVCTTKFNVAPGMVLELLTRISNLLKDYCGVLTEEAIRVNFVLVYELLDEVIDFGYGQLTSTEQLKSFVHNEPVAIQAAAKAPGGGGMEARRSVPSTAANKPISLRFKDQQARKNEIFIDILERLTVLFSPSGNTLRCEVDGSIQMKSFLQGTPDLSVGLNEDLQIGQERGAYGIQLDDCNFHECVNLDNFDMGKAVTLKPPDGEFTLMNYRMSGESGALKHPLPFRVSAVVEDSLAPGRTDVLLKLDADFPARCHGTAIVIRAPMPKGTTSCGYELGTSGQSFSYKKEEKLAVWTIPKMRGASAVYCRLKLTTSENDQRNVKKDLGPISMEFEVPMYVCSGLNIRFLRVTERGRNYVPFRWVRYITHSNSYVFRG